MEHKQTRFCRFQPVSGDFSHVCGWLCKRGQRNFSGYTRTRLDIVSIRYDNLTSCTEASADGTNPNFEDPNQLNSCCGGAEDLAPPTPRSVGPDLGFLWYRVGPGG